MPVLLPLAGDVVEGTPSLRQPAALVWPALAGTGFVWLLDFPGGAVIFNGLAMICAVGLGALLVNIAFASRRYFHARLGTR